MRATHSCLLPRSMLSEREFPRSKLKVMVRAEMCDFKHINSPLLLVHLTNCSSDPFDRSANLTPSCRTTLIAFPCIFGTGTSLPSPFLKTLLQK